MWTSPLQPVWRPALLLQLLVKLAGGARDVHPAGDVALAVLHALDDAGGLAALGAVGALRGVHDFLAICGLCDFGHTSLLTMFSADGCGAMSTWAVREIEADGRGCALHMSPAHAPSNP